MTKNVICLWYDGTAEEAARFYAQTFPDSTVTAVHRAPGDYPAGKQGQVLTAHVSDGAPGEHDGSMNAVCLCAPDGFVEVLKQLSITDRLDELSERVSNRLDCKVRPFGDYDRRPGAVDVTAAKVGVCCPAPQEPSRAHLSCATATRQLG